MKGLTWVPESIIGGKVLSPLATHSTHCFPPFHLQAQSGGQAREGRKRSQRRRKAELSLIPIFSSFHPRTEITINSPQILKCTGMGVPSFITLPSSSSP